jgi:TnpA family transposase
MTDTGAYSDVVFGLFRLLGYRFCPRLADIGGTRFWRIDPQADYGKLNVVSRHRLKLQRIAPHWDDMLRLGGSLLQGRVPATGIMRTCRSVRTRLDWRRASPNSGASTRLCTH